MTQLGFNFIPSKDSPICYPGSKRRMAPKPFLKILPDNINVMASPFLGSASLELLCTVRGIKCYGSDINEPLINCWKYLLDDAKSLIDLVMEYYPHDFDLWKHLYGQGMKSGLTDLDGRPITDKQRAAYFLVQNRQAYNSTGGKPHRGLNKDYFTDKSMERIRLFYAPDLNVEHCDYRVSIEKHDGIVDMFYFDPPYPENSDFYGKHGEDFDHHEFHERITQLQSKWILSYRDHPVINELYDGYNRIEYIVKGRIAHKEDRTELFLSNF